jgi:hypothetical protein
MNNTVSHINENCDFNCIFHIGDLCLKHLAKSITKLDLPKGVNVCFTDWDTNSNKEENNRNCFKIIQLIKDTLLQIKEKSVIDFEYTDKGLDITLKKDAIEFTIHFKAHPLETKFIFDKIEECYIEYKEEYEEKYNVAVNNVCTQSELPLYVIIIDTNFPRDGEIHGIQDEQTIRSSILAYILERFDED